MKKRDNKSKDQILREMQMLEKQKARTAKEKYIAKTVFPFVEGLKTIYDAQTALNAASGYIQFALLPLEEKILVSQLDIQLDKLKADPVSQAVKAIIESMHDVSAKDVASLLERMGQKLAEYVANKHLQDDMTIKTKDFVSE